MRTRTKVLLAGCFSILIFLASCGQGDDDEFRCPSLDDNVTWSSYGRFDFQDEGPDATARTIVSECGWHVFGGHNGGVGETLQVASPNEEVVFVWAFNDFHAFRLTAGWTGRTNQGARLGDPRNVFLSLHPECQFVNANFCRVDDGEIQVEATFDSNGLLVQLLVGEFFRN